MKKFWKRGKSTLTVHPLGGGRYRLDGIDSLSAVGDTERFVQQMEALRTMPPTIQRMSAAPDPGPEPFVITLTGGRWKIGDGQWTDIPAGTEAVVHVESGYFDAPVSTLPWTIPVVPPGARKGRVEFRPATDDAAQDRWAGFWDAKRPAECRTLDESARQRLAAELDKVDHPADWPHPKCPACGLLHPSYGAAAAMCSSFIAPGCGMLCSEAHTYSPGCTLWAPVSPAVKFCYHPNQTAEWKASAKVGDDEPGVVLQHIRRCPDCPAVSVALERVADPLAPWLLGNE